jgi:hypothetical protein
MLASMPVTMTAFCIGSSMKKLIAIRNAIPLAGNLKRRNLMGEMHTKSLEKFFVISQ